MIDEEILFIGDSSRWSKLAAESLKCTFAEVDARFWDYGDTPLDFRDDFACDRIFTFKADWVLTPAVLGRVRKTAINFHPSIPDYRGVGGYNFALLDGRRIFGAMCHHIVDEIDSGPIIKVQRFPILPAESVDALRERTASYCLTLFYEILHTIAERRTLPLAASERWGQRLFTRKMLAELEASDLLATPPLKISA
ncbi:formyltransferase family protein [Breoghania sp. L-A4]|uniref:formyltransferase family protein n=1 Tax=Breoghania sp. L-A4 TaxID=2304600 RepID=UPI000E3600F2|nr:formyltransferase family protein [Breoghania sp. L-A4]AXS39945.1 hypothetical protein D1F64_07585 [Breoghania sp. L-A4]